MATDQFVVYQISKVDIAFCWSWVHPRNTSTLQGVLLPVAAHHTTLATQWARDWVVLFTYDLGAGNPLVKCLGMSGGGFHPKQLIGHIAKVS